MRLLLKTSFLLLLIAPCCFPQDPLPVVGAAWQRVLQKGQPGDSTPLSPARAVIAENKYYQRKAREQVSPGMADPNEQTVDGRSAAIDKAVQESRTPKSEDVYGYSYVASVRNDSGKKIDVVFWEYRFTEIANPANLVRRHFLCAANLKNGGQKELSAFSTLGPSDVIDAASLAKATEKLFNEEIVVNRIEFADGSILQRANWKFDDVKRSVERATSTPWGKEVCRAL